MLNLVVVDLRTFGMDMFDEEKRINNQYKSNGGNSMGVHLFPFRTEKLSPIAPMVLQSNVGE